MAPDMNRRIAALSTHAVGFMQALFGMAGAERAGGRDVQPEDVLTPRQVAKLVHAKEAEVLEAIQRGHLRATQVGAGYRVYRSNVRDWLS
jgi:excisionase family DNA binding protein